MSVRARAVGWTCGPAVGVLTDWVFGVPLLGVARLARSGGESRKLALGGAGVVVAEDFARSAKFGKDPM